MPLHSHVAKTLPRTCSCFTPFRLASSFRFAASLICPRSSSLHFGTSLLGHPCACAFARTSFGVLEKHRPSYGDGGHVIPSAEPHEVPRTYVPLHRTGVYRIAMLFLSPPTLHQSVPRRRSGLLMATSSPRGWKSRRSSPDIPFSLYVQHRSRSAPAFSDLARRNPLHGPLH